MARRTGRTVNTSETTQVKFWDKEIHVKTIQKSAGVQVQVKYVEKTSVEDGETKTLKGLDIREFYKKRDQDTWNPTSKGTVIPLEQLYDLYTAIGDFVMEHIVNASAEEEEEETVPKKKKRTTRKKASGE